MARITFTPYEYILKIIAAFIQVVKSFLNVVETLIFPACIVIFRSVLLRKGPINSEDQEKLINKKLAIDCFISVGAFKEKVVLFF